MNTKLALSAIVAALVLTACAKQESAGTEAPAAAPPAAEAPATPPADANAAPAAPADSGAAATPPPAEGAAAPPPAEAPKQ